MFGHWVLTQTPLHAKQLHYPWVTSPYYFLKSLLIAEEEFVSLFIYLLIFRQSLAMYLRLAQNSLSSCLCFRYSSTQRLTLGNKILKRKCAGKCILMMSDKSWQISAILIGCLYWALLGDYGILSSMFSHGLRTSFWHKRGNLKPSLYTAHPRSHR